ncbi:MAG: LacI family DNA-binding transcriptional regulator [Planctomycetes bacterium]|nr:LacI family DNA-binding transcriptional regulator [Planctomycetota bacterium]
MTREAHPIRPATLADIAAQVQVHKTTVHRALTGAGRMSPELRERIVAVARQMGYDPDLNPAGRRMALAKHGRLLPNRTIALVMPRMFYRTGYFLRIFQGVMDVVTDAGFALHCYPYQGIETGPATAGIARGEVDGIIALAHVESLEPMVRSLRAHPNFGARPFVSLAHTVPGEAAVVADVRSGSCQLAAHLFDLGHRQLLHFHGRDNQLGRPGDPIPLRVAGLRDAQRDRGLGAKALQTAVFEEREDESWVAESLREALVRQPGITAIVARHDPMALEIISLLRRWGLRVPQDISVVGYDDSEPTSVAEASRLSTVAVPLEDMGRRAARMVIESPAQGVGSRVPVVLPVALRLRASTAVPPAGGRPVLS